MDRWWINGHPGRLIDVGDRGLAYGDGLFETVAIRDDRLRFLAEHLDRLQQGCARLRISLPDRQRLAAELTVAARGITHGVLKLILTRGPGPRGYAPPAKSATTLAWGVSATQIQASRPIDVRWCETMASVNPATAGLKSLSRLDQVLARGEWSSGDIAEGLMTSAEGWLIGGTASNVFIVTENRLLTPSVARAGVAGVMRRVVLGLAHHAGIPAAVADIAPSEVVTAKEVFVTNALTGIRPVRALGSRTWVPGPVTRLLQAKLAAAGVGECAG